MWHIYFIKIHRTYFASVGRLLKQFVIVEPRAKMFVMRRRFTHLHCANEYYNAIQPLFCFTHLIGVTSYVVVTNEQGVKSFAVSRLSYIIVTFNLACFAYCSFYLVHLKSTFIGKFFDSDVTNNGEKFIILYSGTMSTTILITNILYGRQLQWVFKHFLKIDRSSERIGIQWNYRKVFYHVIGRLIFAGFVLSSFFVIYMICLRAYPTWQLAFMTLSQMFEIAFTTLLFNFLTLSTRLRIKALNKVS